VPRTQCINEMRIKAKPIDMVTSQNQSVLDCPTQASSSTAESTLRGRERDRYRETDRERERERWRGER